MKRLLAIAVAGIALSRNAPAGSDVIRADLPHVRADGGALTFAWHGGSPHRVDISRFIRSADLDTAHVLTAQRAGDTDYFVVSVSGPARPSDTKDANADGTEASLLWLKLNEWKLLDAQAIPYQSPEDALEPAGNPYIKGGVLTVRYEDARENMEYALRYNLAHPEDRIEIERADAGK